MTPTSLADHRHESTTRTERALRLFEERGDEIQVLGEDLFEVPSCTGQRVYRVRYGGEVESCSCPDRHVPCKHIIAVGIAHAARRSGIREIRIPAVVAGDPFKVAAKRRGCPACFAGYVTITTEEDGQERDEAVPCRRCGS